MLRRGNRGDDVRRLQEQLRSLGADLPTPATEYFGPLTDAAVRKFQREHGLDDDGIVGPDTERALAAALEVARVAAAAAFAGPLSADIIPANYEPNNRVSPVAANYHMPTRRGFDVAERLNITNMPPEVESQANEQGWVMMFMPGDRRIGWGGTGLTGTFYVANVKTGETHAYPAVTGGLSQGDDRRTNGPLAGSKTNFDENPNDAVNAVYTDALHLPNYTSREHRVYYKDAIRLTDNIPDRDGFLIHKAGSRGGTIGCVGLESDAAMAEVSALVGRHGITNMVVLNDDYNFNRTHVGRGMQPSLAYAEASQPDSGFAPNGPQNPIQEFFGRLFGG